MAANVSTTKTIRTVNLGSRMLRTHKPRRIGNAVRLMREDIAKHSKTTVDKVRIGGGLNWYLLNGAMQGFHRVKISVEKTGDIISADLAEKRVRQAPAAKEGQKTPESKKGEKHAQAAKPEPGKEAPKKSPTNGVLPKAKPESEPKREGSPEEGKV